MKSRVGSENRLGEASSLKEVVEHGALGLVKALPDVSTCTGEVVLALPGHFEVQAMEISGVFCPSGRRSASKQLLLLPLLRPLLKVTQPDGPIKPVDLRKDRQSPVVQGVEASFRALCFVEPSGPASKGLLWPVSAILDDSEHPRQPGERSVAE